MKNSVQDLTDTDIKTKTYSFGKLDLNIELSAFSLVGKRLKPVSYKIRYGVNTHKVIKGNWTIESHHSRVNQV